jgi:hypothetical protein
MSHAMPEWVTNIDCMSAIGAFREFETGAQ